jgi:predicted small metal-binding protein
MTRVLKCGDLMPGCDFETRAESDEAILQAAAAHAKEVHHIEVTAELAERVKEAIRLE